MTNKLAQNPPQKSNNYFIAKYNYLTAFQYLDERYQNMSPLIKNTWYHNFGALLNFYNIFIRKLPYNNSKIFKRITLDDSEEYQLTYENRDNISWIIEYEISISNDIQGKSKILK